MKPTNILFMHSHNTGTFVEPFGHAVPTPNLQRLARAGVLFRRAFAAAPTCSPSRAAFLTGTWPHTCGMLGLAHRNFSMQDYGLHLANVLKAHGYVSILAGVEHTAPDVASVGYDRVLSTHDTNYPDEISQPPAAQAAVEFLDSRPQQPFFLSIGLNETHIPYPEPDPRNYPAEDERYCQPPRPLPDTSEIRAQTAAFKASARVMDDGYGAVMDALTRNGLDDNTLVVCFADHGLQFPRNMCNLTDHGIAVYLVIRGPGGFQGGQVSDALVSLVDLVPTVCDVAGLPTPDHAQGTSLMPLVSGDRSKSEDDDDRLGESSAVRDEIFAEVNFHAAYEPMRCVRTQRYKYIRRYDNRQRPVLANMDQTAAKKVLLEHGWVDQPRPREMLYDLIFDTDEVANLVDRPDMAAVLTDMRDRLDRWMSRTDDPLLADGRVDAPAGSKVTCVDGLTPVDGVETML